MLMKKDYLKNKEMIKKMIHNIYKNVIVFQFVDKIGLQTDIESIDLNVKLRGVGKTRGLLTYLYSESDDKTVPLKLKPQYINIYLERVYDCLKTITDQIYVESFIKFCEVLLVRNLSFIYTIENTFHNEKRTPYDLELLSVLTTKDFYSKNADFEGVYFAEFLENLVRKEHCGEDQKSIYEKELENLKYNFKYINLNLQLKNYL